VGVCYTASGVFGWRREMTSAIGVERGERRIRHRRLRRRLRWRTELRSALARELLLIVGGPLLFVSLFALVGPAWAVLLSALAALIFGARSMAKAQRRWHYDVASDHSTQYRWLGRAVLLFAVFSALAYSVPKEKYQEWAALADNPKPTDCDWGTLPLGDKNCHYEPVFQSVNEPGQHVRVEWQRVGD
jgi:hypothetical protein